MSANPPICNACGSTDCQALVTLHSDTDHQVYDAVRCRQCGLTFVWPIPVLSLERLQQLYGMDYTESQRILEQEERDRAVLNAATHRQMEIIEALVHPGHALNIGAMGSANLVLLERGWDLHVVDVSTYAAETAHQKWGLKVSVGRIEDVEFSPASFDLVKLGHVIEHLTDPRAVLGKLHRALKDSGLVLIETDNASGLRTRLEVSIRQLLGERLAAFLVKKLTGKNLRKRYGRLTPPIHLYAFTPHSLQCLLERTGFEIIQLLQPAWGDPVWFPLTTMDNFGFVERAFIQIDQLGARLGHGEVLVAFARKKLSE